MSRQFNDRGEVYDTETLMYKTVNLIAQRRVSIFSEIILASAVVDDIALLKAEKFQQEQKASRHAA